jgi:predicted histidine transporter YuiF (NhaC family)
MPLSEEEQRILHEMEQKLYEHDRAFADRVSTKSSRRKTPRSGKGWIMAFVAGFVLLIVAFRSSVLLGSLGFLVMLVAAVVYVYRMRQSDSARFGSLKGSGRRSGMGDELSEMRRRLRSRFGNRN